MRRRASELKPGDRIDLDEGDPPADIVTVEEVVVKDDGRVLLFVVGDGIPVHLTASDEFTLLEDA